MDDHHITLKYTIKKEWILKYDEQDDLVFYNFDDALNSTGILAKEVSRVFSAIVCIHIIDSSNKLLKESFIFPDKFYLKKAPFLTRHFFKVN